MKKSACVFTFGLFVGALAWGLLRPVPAGEKEQTSMDDKEWTCSMHPQVRSPEPGECPICGMDLVASGGGEAQVSDTVTLTPRAKKLAKLQTAIVKKRSHQGRLSLLGTVLASEKRMKTVTAWTAGRIDNLLVKSTGERVKRGQTIAKLYSPEVYSAHQDLITAQKQVEALSSARPATQSAAKQSLEAVKDRLRLLGVSEGTLTKMAKAKVPTKSLRVRSPFAGTVLKRLATQGQYVDTGAGIYEIADLSQVWVNLEAYESDLSLISVGQKVIVTFEALPTTPLEGAVTFVDPIVDRAKRVANVRVELDNKNRKLKPGMYASANIEVGRQDAPQLVVPKSAVLFTGESSVVYVERAESEYEARVVRLGTLVGESYEVMAGLTAGERVVTRGAFALDSDLQIRGGPSMMNANTKVWRNVEKAPKEELKKIGSIQIRYLSFHESLAKDDFASAKTAAKEIIELLSNVNLEGAWPELLSEAQAFLVPVAELKSLDEVRLAFEQLSMFMTTLLERYGNQTANAINESFCPMAFDNRGAFWWQTGKEIRNPYFGASMYGCGSVKSHLEPSAYKPANSEQGQAGPRVRHQH